MKQRKGERSKTSIEGLDATNGYIRFNCVFTPEIRKIFKEKRQILGLSYNSLAEIIGANWSTLRKWEMGKTINCNIRYRIAIEEFLNDDVNHILLKNQGQGDSHYLTYRGQSSRINDALEKVKMTYLLCSGYPEYREHIWSSLNALACLMLKKLTSNESDE